MPAPIPANHPKVDFIRVELQTGSTLVRLAQTEQQIGDPEAAKRAIGFARRALETSIHFLPELPIAAEVKAELQQKIEALRTEIERYEEKNRSHPAE